MTLIVLSGLPGSGKSTLARQLGAELDCAVISVDTIERGLHEAGVDCGQPIDLAAYAVANRLVDVQLDLGHTVIADAVNHHPDARQAWLDLATKHGAAIRVIHVECSDEALHRERLESRDHELSVVPWVRVIELKETWSPWPVETETVDSAQQDDETTGVPTVHVSRVTTNIPVADLAEASIFYTDYLGLSTEEFNLGWVARYTSPETGAHVQLVTSDATALEDSAISVTVTDVDAACEEAVRLGFEIVHPLTNEEWGVRRFFVRAPDGTVVNVVQQRQ